MNVNAASFEKVLGKNPTLCERGLLGPEAQGDSAFCAERDCLASAFDEFALCCDRLLDCTPLRRVSFVAPPSSALAAHFSKQIGRSISNGALIAAVLHMRLPIHRLPDSTDVLVGVSLRSPILADLQLPKRGRANPKRG